MAEQLDFEQAAEAERAFGQAMSDPVFRRRLLDDPVGTLRGVGVDVPDGVEVKVLENSPTLVHMVLPPADMAELSDSDLDTVAAAAGIIAVRANSQACTGTSVILPGTLNFPGFTPTG